MSLIYPKSTLNYQLARPVFVTRDLSMVPAKMVAGKTEGVLTSMGTSRRAPEFSAVEFYLLDHAMALLRKKYDPRESLGDLQGVTDQYSRTLNDEVIRMFAYLLLICIRETRHIRGNPKTTAAYKHIDVICGKEAAAFNRRIRKGNEHQAVDTFFNYTFKSLTIGQLTDSLAHLFYHAKFRNSAFGGPAWGVVADCLSGFVHGKVSPAVMLDTAFTLAHNNGPIFNKGMLYDMYSILGKVLDIQASGQMPQAVRDGEVPTSALAKIILDYGSKLFGDDLNTPLDWTAIQNSGKNNYPSKVKEVPSYQVDPKTWVPLAERD